MGVEIGDVTCGGMGSVPGASSMAAFITKIPSVIVKLAGFHRVSQFLMNPFWKVVCPSVPIIRIPVVAMGKSLVGVCCEGLQHLLLYK